MIAEAVLSVVNSALGTVASFVNAGAQKYAYQKGIENDTIANSNAKTLTTYNTIKTNNMLIILFIIALIVALIFIKKKKQ